MNSISQRLIRITLTTQSDKEPTIHSNCSFLNVSQWYTLLELESYQNTRLKNLINHAYLNVPYYQQLFNSHGIMPKDINSVDDLKKIPLLTKEIIRNNRHLLVSKNLKPSDYYKTASSGSTGEPLQYLISRNAYSLNIASLLRGWSWMGYRLGDKFVKLSQNPRDKSEKKIQDFITSNYYLYTQQLDEQNFEILVKELMKIKPKIIRGYPDPLCFLAKYCQINNINEIRPLAINSTGNTLTAETRLLIESQFSTKIYDSYSCEGSAAFFECPTHTCLHGSMEYGISEILDINGNPVNSGLGRHITTDLNNYTMPFIRYDTQDFLVKSENKCNCSRNLINIDQVNGRITDILITPKGKYLIVHNFTGYFQRLDTPCSGIVTQFQIHQIKKDHFIFMFVISSPLTKDTEKSILDYWYNYINEDVTIEIMIVDEIKPSESGKRRFLIRNPEIKLV